MQVNHKKNASTQKLYFTCIGLGKIRQVDNNIISISEIVLDLIRSCQVHRNPQDSIQHMNYCSFHEYFFFLLYVFKCKIEKKFNSNMRIFSKLLTKQSNF